MVVSMTYNIIFSYIYNIMVQDPTVANKNKVKYYEYIIIDIQRNNQFSNAAIVVILTNGCVP